MDGITSWNDMGLEINYSTQYIKDNDLFYN